MHIHRLDEALIRKIAAGEVVDRPAAVAKELVENSLDARAGRIEVEVGAGGISLLRVADDGVGMTPEELRLAVERHTTSKVAREEDLLHIRTLGFRGEALAAICAVAWVRLLSRPPGEDAAWEIEVEGGKVVGDRPAARAVGTTVEVRDLFLNVPARRRFLQSPRSEARHTLGSLRRLVLAQPDRAFSIRTEGRTVLDVPGANAPLARVAQVYGERFAERLAVVELREPGLELHALFGPPELSRPTRTDQFLFLFGRPVQPRGLVAAIYQVYGRYLGRGQHPAFFLYLDVDPGLVDVNVHPKKEEVRFRAEGLVMDLLRRAAMRALGAEVAVSLPAARPGPAWAPPPSTAPQAEAGPLFSPGAAARPWRVLGQARASFIVVETEQGLELVDQHASHERVLYETYRDGAEVRVQEFLIPVQVEVPFDRAEALRAAIPHLRELGVVLEPFGERGFLLRGWPAPLADRQTRLGFQTPLLGVAESLLGGEPPLLELWRAIACAAAIKAGETLSQEEQEALIAQWKGTREPDRCPHGRPVAVRLTWEELAHKVGR